MFRKSEVSPAVYLKQVAQSLQ